MDWITSAVFKYWIASLAGVVLGILQIITPYFKDGRAPTKFEWAFAICTAVMGLCAKFVTTGDANRVNG